MINWDAVRLVVDTSIGSRLQKQLLWPKLKKTLTKHGLEAMTPEMRYSYCAARLAFGDFSDYWGWEWRGYKKDDPETGWAGHLYWKETWLPKWGGGYVDKLLVLGEQGVGDAVFFASIIPEAMTRVKEVVYECEARLHTLFERSLPGLVCAPEKPFEERRPGDAYIPAAELMRMFRRSKAHFPGKPYLKPDPERVREFEVYRGRTGLAWYGRQGRIDPLELGIENPLSVQYGRVNMDVETPKLDLKDDIEGIVALCSVLDKVVTVPQSVHHFAGAVGTKTEIIRPHLAGEVDNQIHWDYSTHKDPINKLPWYKDVTVFRDVKTWREHDPNRSKEHSA